MILSSPKANAIHIRRCAEYASQQVLIETRKWYQRKRSVSICGNGLATLSLSKGLRAAWVWGHCLALIGQLHVINAFKLYESSLYKSSCSLRLYSYAAPYSAAKMNCESCLIDVQVWEKCIHMHQPHFNSKELLVSNWRLVHATNVARSPFYVLIPDNVIDRPIYDCNISFHVHCLTSVRNVRLRSTEYPGCATTGTRNEAFRILFISCQAMSWRRFRMLLEILMIFWL